jgi:hypothetical protein
VSDPVSISEQQDEFESEEEELEGMQAVNLNSKFD